MQKRSETLIKKYANNSFVCEKRNLLNREQRNTFEKIDIQCKQA